MTVFEYAIYRAARRQMTPEEAAKALALAKKADAGDNDAASALREMVSRVLFSD